jgi:hypothetical protein
MKMFSRTPVFVFFMLFWACSQPNEVPEMLFQTDFESEAGWLTDDRMEKGDGHSGSWYIRTGDFVPYSPAFQLKAALISQRPIRKAEVVCWIRPKDVPADGHLIFSADAGTTSVYWKHKELAGYLKERGGWNEVTETFEIPDGSFGPDNIIKIYVLSKNNKVIHVDDFSVRFSN